MRQFCIFGREKSQNHFSFLPKVTPLALNNMSAEEIQDTDRRSLLYLDPPYYVKGNDLEHGFTVDDHQLPGKRLEAHGARLGSVIR